MAAYGEGKPTIECLERGARDRGFCRWAVVPRQNRRCSRPSIRSQVPRNA